MLGETVDPRAFAMRTLVILLAVASIAVLTCVGALKFFQRQDQKRFESIHAALEKHGEGAFDPATIAELPIAARRYFEHAIANGTKLYASADLRLGGTLHTGPDSKPEPVTAELRLAPPFGFAWSARLADEKVNGSETYLGGKAAIRFVRGGFLPASQEGAEVARAARARMALESLLVPTTLLPIRGVEWEGIDDTRAKYTLHVDNEAVVVTLAIDESGKVARAAVNRPVVIDRAAGFVDRPFVLEAVEERTIAGLTIPVAYRLVIEADASRRIEFAAPRVLDLAPR